MSKYVKDLVWLAVIVLILVFAYKIFVSESGTVDTPIASGSFSKAPTKEIEVKETKTLPKFQNKVVTGSIEANEYEQHMLELISGDVVVFKPVGLEIDTLYFDMNIHRQESPSRKCSIAGWKGSSGTLGNGLLYRVNESGSYSFIVSSSDGTAGPYKVSIYKSTGHNPAADCAQINY